MRCNTADFIIPEIEDIHEFGKLGNDRPSFEYGIQNYNPGTY